MTGRHRRLDRRAQARLLERVTRRAYSEPGYDAYLDLPLRHEIEYERELRRAAQRAHRRSRFLLWLRRRAY